MASGERRTRGGRVVMLAGLAAQLSVATVGALPWIVLPLSATAYIAACELSDRAIGSRSEHLRWGGTGLAVLGVIVLAPMVLGTDDRAVIKQALGLMLMTAQVGQAMGWRQLRDVRSALMASFGLLVLASSYAPDVLIGIPLLLGWIAIVAGLALLAGLGRREASRTCAAAVALGLVCFLLIPVPPTDAARNRLNALASGRTSARIPADVLSTRQLDLRRRGTPSTAGVLKVPKDSPQLWRSISFDSYDGTSWGRQVQRSRLTGRGPTFAVSAATHPTRTDVVERVPGGRLADGTAWSPGRIVSVSAPDLVAPVVDDRGDVQLPPFTPVYEVTSEQPITDAALLNATEGADETDARWLSLPASLPPRVGQLAREVTAGSTSRYASAVAIANFLKRSATYRLDSPVPLPGEDAVDRFLFVDKTGFCEQFASAQVVMLRSLGIPARLVTGLAYGEPDGNQRLLRISNLHAWTELWVPGVGWVSSDPTAGTQLANASGLRGRVAAQLSELLRSLVTLPGGRPALAAVLAVITVLASTLITRRRPVVVRAHGRTGAVGPGLAAFLRLDERLGPQRRREAESLRELGSRLDPSIAQALAVVERECYGQRQPDPGEVRVAVGVLDRASAPEPAERRVRPGRRGTRSRKPRRG